MRYHMMFSRQVSYDWGEDDSSIGGALLKKALIRLEDMGPGGYYDTPENLEKLTAVARLLHSKNVPFQAAVIPRFVDPGRGKDCSIGDPTNPAAQRFAAMLRGWGDLGVSLGMHGYTHQFGRSVSGEGYEFAYPGCKEDCPPDDPKIASENLELMPQTHAWRRFRMSLFSFHAAGLQPDWFETPHYAASDVQRRILEACSWLLHEDNPDRPGCRQITSRPSKSVFGKTYYVPTPLGYVGGASIEQDISRIMRESETYGRSDLASFFYHPYLEFPYIRLRTDSSSSYSMQSPLHRLIRHFKSNGHVFVSIRSLFRRS